MATAGSFEPNARNISIYLAVNALLIIAFDALLDRFVPQEHQTALGVALALVVLLMMVVVPLALYLNNCRGTPAPDA